MTHLYRIRTIFTGVTGSPYYNNLFFLITGGTPAQANTAAGAFWTAVSASNMTNGLAWSTDGEVDQIDDTNGQVVATVGVTSVTGVGTAGSDPLSPATQGLIKVRTGQFFSGRELRGRVFLPCQVEANNTAGAPTSAIATVWNNAASALISDANSTWAVWGPTHFHAEAVNAASAWNQWAVLRSRRD